MNSNLETTAPPSLSPNLASQPKPKCWLIGNRPEFPLAAGRVARLRGLNVAQCLADGPAIPIPSLFAARNQLVAIDFDLLEHLEPQAKARILETARSGATIYVRGGLEPGRVYSLRPFSDQRFEFSIKPADGYQFSRHPILPAAIASERLNASLSMPEAVGLEGSARPIVSSLHQFGTSKPSIFALEVGAGLVIFDLHADDDIHENEKDLVAALADPSKRTAAVGALAAVDWAAGRNLAIAAAVNIVIDDRPTNYDYFNAGRLDAFLQHLESRYPGTHTDFAWTPSYTRPHRRYLEVLRRYNTGFVWHGLWRHIDHKTIKDLDSHLIEGRKRVDEIWRDYGARLQPVMIFPFERATPQADELLRQSGFRAQVQSAGGLPPSHYYRLRAKEPSMASQFSVIFRDSVGTLNREQMLALATLGMPIVALAHPYDVGLRRFPRADEGSSSYFDPILEFAAEKSLRPMSLEEIAAEVPADPR